MRNLIAISLLSITLTCFSSIGLSQQFAKKSYYLIDSLVLSDLHESDSQLIDSCLKIFHTAPHDTTKINAIYAIVDGSWDANVWPKYNDWVYHFVKKKLQNKDETTKGYRKKLLNHLSIAYNNMGVLYITQGDISKALKFSLKSLLIQEHIGDDEGIAQSLNNIGYMYNNQGDIEKALEYYLRSLKIQEKIGHKEGVAASLNNIGNIYKNQKDINKALDYYNKSLKLEKEIGNKNGIASGLNNIAGVYKDQNNLEAALEYYNKSLKIREELNDNRGIAESLNNIGTIYNKQGEIPKALDYYKESLKIREEIKDKVGITSSLNSIANVMLSQGNLKEAKKNVKRSLEISKELGYPVNIRNAAEQLSEIYEKEKNGMEALSLYKLYIVMRDSINNEETQKITTRQQIKYEYEKQKSLDDAKHEKLLAIKQKEKQKQQIIIYATAAGLALVIVFLIFVFNRLKITNKQKLVIEEQKEVVEAAHNQLEEKNKEILDSINYAKRIQSAILPPEKMVKKYLKESFILYKPKDIVAGDFYWVENHTTDQKDSVLFAAADCTGHGVPGAMVSVVCKNALDRSIKEHGLSEPGQILDKTREIIIQEFEKSDDEVNDGMDIALCAITDNNLQYAGAYNPLWLVRKSNSNNESIHPSFSSSTNENGYQLFEIKGNKQPIGKFDNPVSYETHTIKLEKGDTLYIFSDGYVDQFGGEKGKKFKALSFRKLLLSIQEKSMSEQISIIDKAFEDWKGDMEQVDDVCVIGVRV
ncbi:MAG: tetratricopeptide repeat protein [Vicingus serpentipes]|nr:tetratricopeptide repeat protein [Vicingus serpentipes]